MRPERGPGGSCMDAHPAKDRPLTMIKLIAGVAVVTATAAGSTALAGRSGDPGELAPAWRAPVGTDGASSPVPAGGRVWAGTAHGLAGLDPATGAVIRVKSAAVSGTPAVLGGSLIFGSRDGLLHAVGTTGDPLWQVSLGAPPAPPLVLGTHIVVGAGPRVFALDGDGRRLWTTTLEGDDISAPAAAIDGLVIVAAGWRLHALDATTGELRWSATPSSFTLGAPVIDARRGTALVGDEAGTLFTIDPRTGRTLGSFAALGAIAGAAVGDGVFAGDRVRSVFALGGWQADLGAPSGPPVLDRGVVYVATDPASGTPRLVALDARSGRRLAAAELPAGTSSAPAVIDGRVVVATRDGDLVAVHLTHSG